MCLVSWIFASVAVYLFIALVTEKYNVRVLRAYNEKLSVEPGVLQTCRPKGDVRTDKFGFMRTHTHTHTHTLHVICHQKKGGRAQILIERTKGKNFVRSGRVHCRLTFGDCRPAIIMREWLYKWYSVNSSPDNSSLPLKSSLKKSPSQSFPICSLRITRHDLSLPRGDELSEVYCISHDSPQFAHD